jgi:hypothetical protein
MTDYNLPVVQSSLPDAHIRAVQTGTTNGKPIIQQTTRIVEHVEIPVDPTGGLTRHSVTSTAVIPLDPPTAAADFARIRVFNTNVDPGFFAFQRVYFRSDGTNPTNDGGNAFGYLMHGDSYLVKIPDKTLWKMIAQAGASFEIYVEYFNQP